MTTRYSCDRCHFIGDRQQLFAIHGREINEFGHAATSIDVDLCRKCHSELELWMTTNASRTE